MPRPKKFLVTFALAAALAGGAFTSALAGHAPTGPQNDSHAFSALQSDSHAFSAPLSDSHAF